MPPITEVITDNRLMGSVIPVNIPDIFTAIRESKPVSIETNARRSGLLCLSILCIIAKAINVISIIRTISQTDILIHSEYKNRPSVS
ncbi:MAG: hypothetical protein PUD24_08225 [Oscillospiraceae bacterium]|nr:hypothetical protein [Oscillospiraceae bacterium]